MKYEKKLEFIRKNNLAEWLKTRQSVEKEFSSLQPMFCVCGRLATGIHERSCRKFNDKINRETVKRLSNLLSKQTPPSS